MAKLKLLVLTRDDRNYTVPASHYFMEELAKSTELVISHQSGKVTEIIESLEFVPDFVYLHDYMENFSPVVTGLKELNLPYAVSLHDLHYEQERRKVIMKEEGIRHVFTYYRDRFRAWYPEFAENMIWSPHHANTDLFKDYQLERDIGMLLTGAMYDNVYPLRSAIAKRFRNHPEFKHIHHPGYRQIGGEEQDVWVGDRFALLLNRAKISFTCNSTFKYSLMKYFEIAACNSLLMASHSQEISDLGFIPGVHYVSIDDHNFEEKANYYLKHPEERERIARNGMHMVHERHSTKVRVSEFVEAVEGICLGSSPLPSV
ncbi:glycosyltransferase [Paenibacillus daejeonensis]|uniref:glycosyltransferase n=1 Tax=Paenibacillus daejeonensis TaxID=135193 RepID=UPI00037F140E|nr:glycosyltransferase [Paenibacillus daejeonensis]